MRIKAFFVLIFFCMLQQAIAQNCDTTQVVCGNSAWDWELEDCRMWVAQINNDQQSARTSLHSPFHSHTLPKKLAEIKRTRDYTRAKGWRLVTRDFGCEVGVRYPYFILYNKYLDIMRVFVFYESDLADLNGYVMRLSVGGGQKPTGFAASGRFPAYTPDRYLNNDFEEGDSPTDHQLIYVGGLTETFNGNWLVGDFRPDLDVHINHVDYRDTDFTIAIYGVKTSTLTAKISPEGEEFTDDIVISTNNSGNGVSVNANGGIEIITEKAGTITGYIVKGEELLKKFVESKLGGIMDRNVTDGSLKKLQDILTTKNVIDMVKDINSAVGVAVSVLSVVGEMVGIFDDGSGAVTSQTAVANSTLHVTGKLVTEAGLLPIQIFVPGTLKSATESNSPFYDCAYGLANLTTAPVIQVQPFLWDNAPGDGTEHYRSYKVKNNLNFQFNSETGYTYALVQASLGAEIPLGWASDQNKPVAMQIEQGRLRVVDVAEKGGGDSGEPEKERMLVHTVPVDFKHIKDISMQLPVSADPANIKLFVRVYAVLGKPGSTVPAYFIRDYAVKTETLSGEPRINFSSQLPPFANYSSPFYSGLLDEITADPDQVLFDGGDLDHIPDRSSLVRNRQIIYSGPLRNYYERHGQFSGFGYEPYNGTVTLKAGEVVLKNGFKTVIDPAYNTPGVTFRIASDNASRPQTGNSTISVFTPAICIDPEINAAQLADDMINSSSYNEQNPIALKVEANMNFWPNPVQDVLNVHLPLGGVISIVDYEGNEVMRTSSEESGGVSLNMTGLKKGNYILNYVHAYGNVTRRLVLNK